MPQIRDVLVVSDTAMNSAQIANAVYGSKKSANVNRVQEALPDLIGSGSVFEHPPARKGQRKRFWRDSPLVWTGERILQVVNAREKLTLRSARDAIPSSYRPFFDEALGQLIREEKVYPLNIGRFKYILSKPPRPTEYLLTRHITAIKEIIAKVNPHRKTKLNVADVECFLDGHEIVIKRAPPFPGDIPDSMMLTWYKEDVRTLMGSRSVPIPWTWSRYEKWSQDQGSPPDLDAFHDKFKQLARDGKIELVPHGMSEPIAPEELKIAIRTGLGELLYFWKWPEENPR